MIIPRGVENRVESIPDAFTRVADEGGPNEEVCGFGASPNRNPRDLASLVAPNASAPWQAVLMTDWIDPDGWPRDRYSGVGGGMYTGVGGGLYTGVGGGAYTGVGGGAYAGVGGGAYTGVGGGLYTGPGGGCYTGPGGGLYTGPGGGLYTGPGGGLYTGPGGGAYSGPSSPAPRRNWPPIPILLAYLRQRGLSSQAQLIANVYGLN